MRRPSLPLALVAAVLFLLPLILTGSALTGQRAFMPADLLRHVAPWKRESPETAWNVLRFDGIAQFYPWRLAAARSYQSGKLPLWNPNAFAADGGTPLWANSQSAPLYPLNLPFWLLPTSATWYAFGLGAALHLTIAALGIYRLARSLGLERAPAALSSVSFTLSGPVVCWLALPTFLCVSAWLPWVVLAVRRACDRPDLPALTRIAIVVGLALLGGHLQIGLYVVLTGLVYFGFHAPERLRKPGQAFVAIVGILAHSGMLAAPQIVPSVELSRSSHRAYAARPTMEGYRAYAAAAFPVRALATFVLPDFYGHPIDGTHWNDSEVAGRRGGNNYAEWACYVGVAPLLLAFVALVAPWSTQDSGILRERRPIAIILGLALALALGTPLNLLTYFGLPGFSQTGNPARVLVVCAFALSLLAGIGLQILANQEIAPAVRRRALALAGLALTFVVAIGASQSVSWAAIVRPDLPYARLMDLAMPGTLAGGLWLAIALVLAACQIAKPSHVIASLFVGLALLDLGTWASRYNPATAPGEVYAVTPGIRWLQKNAKGAAIAPINTGWSMGARSPRAVLPPNALTVFGLKDIAGYDSLFPADRKDRLKSVNGTDPSPPENGNLVFVKGLDEARAAGAAFVVTRPDADPLALPIAYEGLDLKIYRGDWPTIEPPAPPPPTTGLKVGLFLGALGLGALGSVLAARPLTRL